MILAPVPADEEQRLAALHALALLELPHDPVYDTLARHMATVFGTSMAGVALVDRDRIWFRAELGMNCYDAPRAISFCGHVVGAVKAQLLVPDARADDRFADNPLVTTGSRLRFYAGSKLLSPEGHALGALFVCDADPKQPTPEQLELLDRFADVVSRTLVMESAMHRLQKLATMDTLTGLYNRQGFDIVAGRLMGTPFHLLMIDLNGFKLINDQLGHQAGDAALVELARRLRMVTRRADCLARLGGDEFVVLIRGEADAFLGVRLAQRIHHVLAAPFHHMGQALSLKASIGVARAPRDGQTLQTLLQAADAAMYREKAATRGTEDEPLRTLEHWLV